MPFALRLWRNLKTYAYTYCFSTVKTFEYPHNFSTVERACIHLKKHMKIVWVLACIKGQNKKKMMQK